MSFNKALAIDTVTITDLTDTIVSVEEPTDPANGTLWIDISAGEDEGILKQYIIRDGEDKGQWVSVKLNMEYLNPELSETVKFVNKQLTDMGDDGLLTYGERVELSKMIAEITGESPSTTTSITVGYKTSLPTPETLDSGGSGGTFFKYRYSARQVGINEGKDKGNPIYANLENAYNELNDYISQFTPKPWDITINNKDLVVELGSTADKLREVFLNYYTAALALSELTKERGVEVSKEYTDEGIDNIAIGGTNLISKEKSKEGTSLDSKGNEISDILYNTSDFIEVVGGKDYSMSIFVTPQTESEFIKYAWYDSSRTFISSGGLTDTNKTIKAPENAKYIRVAYLKDIKPKFESGNKPTDWSPNPDDIESQIEHTQASLTVTSNAIRGIVLETIGGAEVATIDEETGEIIYIDTKKTRLSKIEQKSDGIISSVSENTGAISSIRQTVNSISSTVSENTGAITEVEQTVNSISSTVSENTGAITKVKQTSESILQRVQGAEDSIADLKLTDGQIIASVNTKVDNKDYSASVIVGKINNGYGVSISGDKVNLQGRHITLNGDTTVMGSFKVGDANISNLSANTITTGTLRVTSAGTHTGRVDNMSATFGGNYYDAKVTGSFTGFNANSNAFAFDYGTNSFEVQGRIGANPGSNRHAIEINGLTLHNDSASFKNSSSGYELRSIGELNLRASTVRINGKEIYDNGKGGWASR